ncbi:hypothetical protein ATE92_1424 [Ulvibacter sp. MAR_2010_11]|uniref:hypothetical protein n=1 Tax=Ulvibacter sp. MAR_2010_11 TaxID=1250229 RepID=UPI000C2C080D|nr:hypothetical protein [Ulvibacter sp. MAR_2010_11]PKA83274.1 hypothetical protein ATE92_1424 [Ulvibacter sp. MAR_2010_11]
MKNITLLTLLLLTFIGSQAQYNYYNYKTQENNVGVQIDRYQVGTDIFLPDSTNGTPFYNDTFLPGQLYENNEVVASNLFFRFNVMEDEIEVTQKLTDENTAIQVLTKDPSLYVKIDKHLIIYDVDSEGYFQVLAPGNNFSLYKKLNKKYYPPRLPRNSFEKEVLATYKDDHIYYLVSKDNKFVEIPSTAGKRTKFFGSKKPDITKFIKSSDLDMNEEEDLIRVFRYFDSLSGN